MKNQKSTNMKSLSTNRDRLSFYENEPKKEFLDLIQNGISNIEIHSSFFYLIQKLEMLIIVIISSFSFFTIANSTNPILNKINYIVSLLYISPSYFENPIYGTYFIIGIILFLTLLMISFTLLIERRIQNNLSLNQNVVKFWIILTRLFLPLPGHIIGNYYGYYLFELTHSIHFNQLAFITFAGTLWYWTLITCNAIYNSYPFKRKSDVCHIKHDYYIFQNIILIFPMLQGIGPSFAKVFFPLIDYYVYSILTFFISLFFTIFISIKSPYADNAMNYYTNFLFITRMLISLILIIEKNFTQYFTNYCLFILLYIIITPIIIQIYIFYTKTTNKSSQNLNTSNKNTSQSPKSTDEIFDPTINLPFPLNRVSLTKTDLFLYIFVFSCAIFMEILNAIAAQRLPAINPLPDFIHKRFIISKCIRSNFTNTYSQISNDFILFQIALLFFILFVFPEHFDFRRAVLIYGIVCLIRSISFILTSLPVPCAGDPNCPCADRKILKDLQAGNPVKIAMSWLFGLGMFLRYPECGDLIISGHTVCIWLFTRTCSAALKSAIERPFSWLVSGFLYTFSFFSMGYIIMAKNHYSIDVWLGFVLTEMLWTIYNAILRSALKKPKKNDTLAIRLIRWIETRTPRREIIVYNDLKNDVDEKENVSDN